MANDNDFALGYAMGQDSGGDSKGGGFAYGSQVTNLKSRKWTHWYKHPAINYGEVSEPAKPEQITLGSRLLKKGMKGEDVKMLQQLLGRLGYELEIDGDFGSKTEEKVMAFQTDFELEVDGKYGNLSHEALMSAIADHDAGQPETESPQIPVEPAPEEETAKPTATMIEIVSKGGDVNIRTGNSAEYAKITSVKSGSRFIYVATAANGWNAVEINGQVGWVSGEYSNLVK